MNAQEPGEARARAQGRSVTWLHILTGNTVSPNGEAFLFPLLHWRRALARAGLRFRVFEEAGPAFPDADVLLVDRTYYGSGHRWPGSWDAVNRQLDGFRRTGAPIVWVDTTASTGTLQSAVLSHVDLYCKPQLLRDRSLYGRRFYGGRIYTDHYHRTAGITDDEPQWSEPLASDGIQKLWVSWNSCLANYGRWRNPLAWLHRRTGLHWFLRVPAKWTRPDRPRPIPLSARFSVSYPRATIRYQRQTMREILNGNTPVGRVSAATYHRELDDAQIALSPFGWGEKCYRDYEAFLHGALLVKPDVSHMETWPDLYGPDSIVAHDWDLKDLPETLRRLQQDPDRRIETARRGQANYRRHVQGPEAARLFVEHVKRIVDKARSVA